MVAVPLLGVVGGGSGATSNQVSNVALETALDEAILAMAGSHTGPHRPHQDPAANRTVLMLTTLVSSGTATFAPPGQQGPGDRVICYAIKAGGKILRYMVNMILDQSTGEAATVVIRIADGQKSWFAAYEQSRQGFISGDRLRNFRRDYPDATVEQADCAGDFPKPPTPLSP